MRQNKSAATVIVGGGIAILLFTFLLGSWFQIDEGERGVLLRNGAIVRVAEPGLGFKIPMIDSVKKISTQSHTSGYNDVQAYSRDQQAATLRVSVTWRIDPADVEAVYRSYGSGVNLRSRLIDRQIGAQMEKVFGGYTAVKSVQERGQFAVDYSQALRDSITGPVVIEGVQVENLDFSDAYEQSIEERMKAEVAVKTREQNLEMEEVQARIAVTQAQAEADSRLAKAKAEAEATRLRGEAEADAIRAKAEALASNLQLVELTKAERWDGVLPTTMLPNNTIPFLDAKK
ncbi:MAG: prohibitin family protein [Pseudomonas formosensis]|nr:prohibitin family protein [Halopseudomonas formosensis]